MFKHRLSLGWEMDDCFFLPFYFSIFSKCSITGFFFNLTLKKCILLLSFQVQTNLKALPQLGFIKDNDISIHSAGCQNRREASENSFNLPRYQWKTWGPERWTDKHKRTETCEGLTMPPNTFPISSHFPLDLHNPDCYTLYQQNQQHLFEMQTLRPLPPKKGNQNLHVNKNPGASVLREITK